MFLIYPYFAPFLNKKCIIYCLLLFEILVNVLGTNNVIFEK